MSVTAVRTKDYVLIYETRKPRTRIITIKIHSVRGTICFKLCRYKSQTEKLNSHRCSVFTACTKYPLLPGEVYGVCRHSVLLCEYHVPSQTNTTRGPQCFLRLFVRKTYPPFTDRQRRIQVRMLRRLTIFPGENFKNGKW